MKVRRTFESRHMKFLYGALDNQLILKSNIKYFWKKTLDGEYLDLGCCFCLLFSDLVCSKNERAI